MPEKIVITDPLALQKKAREFRLEVLDVTTKVGSGHVSSSYSAVEILTALYFGGVLRYRPDEAHWPDPPVCLDGGLELKRFVRMGSNQW